LPFCRSTLFPSLVGVLLLGAGTARAADCLTPRERQAHEVYALRTEALVGAQSCRMLDRFNVFATRFSAELVDEGRTLRAHYLRLYGKRGDAKLDDFVTSLSNTTFVRGSEAGDFCGATAALFDRIEALPVGQLAAFSHGRPAPALPPVDACDKQAAVPVVKLP
jgi:hypothetical protein